MQPEKKNNKHNWTAVQGQNQREQESLKLWENNQCCGFFEGGNARDKRQHS